MARHLPIVDSLGLPIFLDCLPQLVFGFKGLSHGWRVFLCSSVEFCQAVLDFFEDIHWPSCPNGSAAFVDGFLWLLN